MNRIILVSLMIASLGLGMGLRAVGAEEQGQAAPCFRMYDATLFQGRPNLLPDGLERVSVLDINRALKKTLAKNEVPDADSIRQWLNPQPRLSRVIILDVEHLPLAGDAEVVLDSLAKYRRLLADTRGVVGRKVIGYYAVPPIRDYWRAVESTDSAKYKKWQSENDKWQQLADDVDAIFPSLYTFYDDQDGWVRYAKGNLQEARRMSRGKPVYAFIWPQYHESNKKLAYSVIPGPYWKLQLETIAKYADGVVIWGGFQRKWDSDAPWWLVTREYAREFACRTPVAPQAVEVDTSS